MKDPTVLETRYGLFMPAADWPGSLTPVYGTDNSAAPWTANNCPPNHDVYRRCAAPNLSTPPWAPPHPPASPPQPAAPPALPAPPVVPLPPCAEAGVSSCPVGSGSVAAGPAAGRVHSYGTHPLDCVLLPGWVPSVYWRLRRHPPTHLTLLTHLTRGTHPPPGCRLAGQVWAAPVEACAGAGAGAQARGPWSIPWKKTPE